MAKPSNSFLDEYVLDATANDYESLSTITPDVRRFAAGDGRDYSDEALKKAVEGLVNAGKLRVYKYSQSKKKYEPAQFSKTEIEDLWFCSRS